MDVLRLIPPGDESPWLIRANNHSDPFKATATVEKRMPPLQARRGRASIIQNGLRNLDEQTAKRCSPAHRLRRVLPTVAPMLQMEAYEKAALSNWRETSDKEATAVAKSMAALYDSSKVNAQMVSKMMRIFAIQVAVAKKKEVNLAWPAYATSFLPREALQQRTLPLAEDIKPPEGESHAILAGASFPWSVVQLHCSSLKDS